MKLIALGSNLPHPEYGAPRQVVEQALALLEQRGIHVVARSSWYETSPVPRSDQPLFINGVAAVETALEPAALLAELHAVEAELGRVRRAVNEARIVDLDLLDADGLTMDEGGKGPVLPHPRLHLRRFVLEPLAELAPDWRHPVSGLGPKALLEGLPPDDAEDIVRLPDTAPDDPVSAHVSAARQ
jgi:2-amino-4-hydroxy-6-hydroxymethyldihydropteridine diphosphokinase